jgi:UDP-N-acetyl-D-glucosamine dehydrogenase
VEYGRRSKISLPLIKIGLEENEEMTAHVAKKLISLYVKGMRVFLYGLTYKKDVKDIRESPVLRLTEMLRNKHVPFAVYDPLFTGTEIANLGLQPGNLGIADIFIVGTDHRQLKKDYTKCIGKHTIVVDGRNFFSQKVGKALYGVGRTLV